MESKTPPSSPRPRRLSDLQRAEDFKTLASIAGLTYKDIGQLMGATEAAVTQWAVGRAPPAEGFYDLLCEIVDFQTGRDDLLPDKVWEHPYIAERMERRRDFWKLLDRRRTKDAFALKRLP